MISLKIKIFHTQCLNSVFVYTFSVALIINNHATSKTLSRTKKMKRNIQDFSQLWTEFLIQTVHRIQNKLFAFNYSLVVFTYLLFVHQYGKLWKNGILVI